MKAIYDDGSVRSFSIAISNDPVVYVIPDSDGTEIPSLPEFCRSPLLHSCFRALSKLNDTEFYSPTVNTKDVFVLERVLEHGNEISLRKGTVSLQCNPNDFAISSGNLLIACRPIGSSDGCTYLYNDQCHNFPPQNIENLVTDPVAFTVPVTNLVNNSGGGKIMSVVRSRGLQLIIFSTSHQLKLHDIPDDCQTPLKLSRQESTILLACANATQYMVNITELPAKFFHIDSAAYGSLLALSDKGYALFSSPPQLTVQNITSEYAVTVSINDRQGSVIYADFTSDGKYAFVVTNVTVIFIHVTEALAGSWHDDDSQSFYFFPIQICFVCPSVQFLNTTTAVISAREGDRYLTTLLFLSISQWPPYVFLNKTLHGFPKQYWYIAAGSSAEIVLSTTKDKMTIPSTINSVVKSEDIVPTTTSSPSNSDNHDDSISTIAVILFPIISCLVIFILVVIVALLCRNTQKGNTNPKLAPPLNLQPVQERNRPSPPAAATLQSISIGHMHDNTRYR